MMDFFNKYPYTDFHELNLDWIINRIKELTYQMEGWQAANTIHYAGVFDITQQYPAWSVVIDNNYGYISKKPVPAGIAVTNENYWENIADFSALYADLGARVSALESAVNAINTELNNLTAPWGSRKIIYVGDSYGRGRTYPATYGYSWCDEVTNVLHPSYSYNLCVSSACFSPDVSASLRYGYQLEGFKNTHSAAECNAITDIIIAGGYNETFYNSDIVTATADYCASWTAAYIRNNFPNARVFLGYIGRVPIFGGNDATFNNFRDRIAAYKDICTKFGWKYIHNSEYMCHDYSKLTNDGIHFKTEGYAMIGHRIAEAINSGSWEYPQQAGSMIFFTPLSSTSDNSIIMTNPNDATLYYQMTNSGVNIFTIQDMPPRFDCNNTTLDHNEIRIAKYYDKTSEKYTPFVAQYNKRYPALINLYNGDSRTDLVSSHHGYIVFTSDGILKAVPAPDDYWADNITVNRIYILPQNITMAYSDC